MSEITITKTVGVKNPNGTKDFRVDLSNGTSWMILRTGHNFTTTINRVEFSGTLKSLKDTIEVHANSGDLELGVGTKAEPETIEPDFGSEFDCVHPCVLLIDRLGWDDPVVAHTLDCYGWLDENGNPDMAAVNRELERKPAVAK